MTAEGSVSEEAGLLDWAAVSPAVVGSEEEAVERTGGVTLWGLLSTRFVEGKIFLLEEHPPPLPIVCQCVCLCAEVVLFLREK